METCYKHGEILSMRCRQCEIEKMSVVIVRDEGEELVALANKYLEELDWAVAYTGKTQEVFDAGKVLAGAVIKHFAPPGPFPGPLIRLEQIEEDIKKAQDINKEKFKPNAWHKPPND